MKEVIGKIEYPDKPMGRVNVRAVEIYREEGKSFVEITFDDKAYMTQSFYFRVEIYSEKLEQIYISQIKCVKVIKDKKTYVETVEVPDGVYCGKVVQTGVTRGFNPPWTGSLATDFGTFSAVRKEVSTYYSDLNNGVKIFIPKESDSYGYPS